MAWANAKPTVTDAANSVTIHDGAVWAQFPSQISIVNEGPNTAYIGPVGVVSTTGYPIAINEKFSTTISPGNKLVARCATGETAVLRILSDTASG